MRNSNKKLLLLLIENPVHFDEVRVPELSQKRCA